MKDTILRMENCIVKLTNLSISNLYVNSLIYSEHNQVAYYNCNVSDSLFYETFCSLSNSTIKIENSNFAGIVSETDTALFSQENSTIDMSNSIFTSILSRFQSPNTLISGLNSRLFANNCVFSDLEIQILSYADSYINANGIMVQNCKPINQYEIPFSIFQFIEKSIVIFNNSSFVSNNNDHGIITVVDSQFEGNNLVFKENSALSGSCITNFKSNIIVKNSSFKENSAKESGGAIMIYKGRMQIYNTAFISNQANFGGDIYVIGHSRLNLEKVRSARSVASSAGDFIYSNDNVIINTTQCQINYENIDKAVFRGEGVNYESFKERKRLLRQNATQNLGNIYQSKEKMNIIYKIAFVCVLAALLLFSYALVLRRYGYGVINRKLHQIAMRWRRAFDMNVNAF